MSGENGKIWYLFDKGSVSGPFDVIDLKKLTDTGVNPDAMIWRGGHNDWISFRSWGQSHLGWQDVWYVSSNGYHNGPFALEEISEKIKLHQVPLAGTRLWTTGLKRWVNVFEVSELTRTLGLQSRRHFRAPFVGQVQVQGLWWRRMVTGSCVSAGGMGLTGLGNIIKFSRGNKVTVKFNSDLFSGPVSAKAQIIYHNEKTTGLQFTEIAPQSLQVVTDYVRQFEDFKQTPTVSL